MSVISARLAPIATSLVVASLASLAFADVAYVPAAGAPAPVMRRAPSQDLPVPPPAPPPQRQHYAKPPPSGHADAPRYLPDEMSTAALRVVLKAKRAQNLAAFRAYTAAGVYPSNTYTYGSLNVWRDRDGHLCAAATMIAKSGATDLVARVAEQNNNIKLSDVQQGPLEDWMLTSGFTQEEMAMIQRPFMPVHEPKKPTVDPDMRATETARLQKLYKEILVALAKDEDASLDLAAQRLFKHPTLAWQVLGYTPAS